MHLSKTFGFVTATALFAFAHVAQAQIEATPQRFSSGVDLNTGPFLGGVVVYDNLETAATAGTSRAIAENPIFGDRLVLPQGGRLGAVGLSLFNSTSGGNTGAILTGTMLVNFYDNTVPYAGGAIGNPLLGSTTLNWDFTASGGLAAGFYTTDVYDIYSLNITVPQNVLITQQFTMTSGTSLRNGIVLLSDPVAGSSPADVFMQSSVLAAGLYAFAAPNPNQFGYYLEVVPEPATASLAALGIGAMLLFRRRKA